MKNPKISIIVPIYNTEKYLPKCIESIQNQTYKNLEIILVNDGSTDNSLTICQEFVEKDKRIIVIDKENEGVSSARNRGLDFASGEYIGFVDSDDYIAPDMYQQLLTACLENDADIAECGYYSVNENYEIVSIFPLKNAILNSNYESCRALVKGENTSVVNWNKLYKKPLFETIRFSTYRYAVDFWVNSRIFYECKRKVALGSYLYYYLVRETSMWHAPFKEEKIDALFSAKDIYEFYETKFPDLCPFVALKIDDLILAFYRELKTFHSKEKQKKYLNYLVEEFKKYYRLVNGDVYRNIRFTKRYISLLLFHINPELHCIALKIYSRTKKISLSKIINIAFLNKYF